MFMIRDGSVCLFSNEKETKHVSILKSLISSAPPDKHLCVFQKHKNAASSFKLSHVIPSWSPAWTSSESSPLWQEGSHLVLRAQIQPICSDSCRSKPDSLCSEF